jgi:hypothetical protein
VPELINYCMRASAITLFLIMVTGISLKVSAQSPLGNSTPPGGSMLSLTIVQLMYLSVTSAPSVDFNFSTISNLDQGIEKTGAVTLTFRSNKQWLVTIQAQGTGNFTGGSVPMHASILKYRLGGTSTYTSLTTTAAPVTSSGMPRGAGTIGVDYKMNPGYVYAPANYSLTILYTLSNQ